METDIAEYVEGTSKLNTAYGLIGIHSDLPVVSAKSNTTPVTTLIVSKRIEQYHSAIFLGSIQTQPEGDIPVQRTLAASPIKTSAEEKLSRRYLQYASEFLRLWRSKEQLFAGYNTEYIWQTYKSVIHEVLQLKPGYISFDLTDDSSIFFKANVKEFNVYLEVFFEDDSLACESVVNIYQDGKVILAYGGQLNAVFSKIEDVCGHKTKVIPSTSATYEVSGAYFATPTF